MISHEHNCIFVHIPKTAGNSVNRVFGVEWQDHKDLQRYHAELSPGVFDAYFKFAIVRNPWARLLSDYNYQLKKSRPADSKLFVFTASGSPRGFAAWVEAALSTSHGYAAGQWGGSVSEHIHRWSPQVDWISVEGRIAIDYVARLEHLPQDFRVVCQRLELPPARLPHRNRRLHWHYSHYYDRTTREIVARYYARDIEEFGYEFEDSILRLRVAWPFAARSNAGVEAGDSRPGNPVSVHFPAAPRRWWARRVPLALAAGLALFFAAWTAKHASAPESREPRGQRSNVERVVVRRLLHAEPSHANIDPLSDVLHLMRRTLESDVILLPSATGFFNVLPIGNLDEPTPAPVRRAPRVIPWRGPRENFDSDDRPRPRARRGAAAPFLQR